MGQQLWLAASGRRPLNFFARPQPAAREFPELIRREREVLTYSAQAPPTPRMRTVWVRRPKNTAILSRNIFSKPQVVDNAAAIRPAPSGRTWRQSVQPRLARTQHCLNPVSNLQLAVDVRDMVGDGLFSDN